MQFIELKIGNVLDKLKEIPDNSVDCVCTSPPYYGLRKYKAPDVEWRDWHGQLGLEPDYRLYLDHLLIVTAELKRVLKPTGTLWWNMGDSYAGNMGKRSGWTDNKINQSKEEAIANGTAIFMKADYGMPSKSLMQLPTRFAIRMADEQGWILRNTLIWHKRNHMPSSVKDRLSNGYEFIFFFTKQKHYFFNLDAVRAKSIWADKDKRSLQRRVIGKSGKITEKQYATNAVGYHPLGKNPGDVLELTTQPFKGAHFAVFPPKLPEFCIKAGSPENGIVLDPFAGSGTTMLVAKQLGRSAIGIELSEEYAKMIKQRLGWGCGLDIEWKVD